MPTVVQINSFSGGSTGRIARLINEKARNQGWKTYFFYGRNWGNNIKGEGKFALKIEILLHVFLARIFDSAGLFSYISTAILIKKLKRIRPDIVHIHNIHGYYINYKQLFKFFKRSNDIQVVWTLHDCWSFTGHCSHFDLVGCDKWKYECHHCCQKNEYPKSVFFDRSRSNYQIKKDTFQSLSDRLYIVSVSNWLNNLLDESFLKDIKSSVIHNGVDLNDFKYSQKIGLRDRYALGNKIVLLGVASPWSARKGMLDFDKLARSVDERRFVVVMIGVDESTKSKLATNIISIPKTNSVHELAEWYSTADIFLNLTYEDNFPTTNLEALACGTPVITYATGGSPEAISSTTGCVVPKGDIAQLISSIETISNNGKEHYLAECRERAELNFDKSDCFNRYIQLYEQIIR